MRKGSRKQLRAVGLLLCALAFASTGGRTVFAQDSAPAQLLEKAHTLELRGRMDMAQQVWQQVLLTDPNNTEALAGLARAAKSQGHIEEANGYLAKLRAVNPSDPNIAKVENMGTAQDPNILLQQAGKLSQQGQYGRAMALLKQVYGNNPPPGEAALSYYQTEAATEDTRPQAIAGLRALMDKYPNDQRYAVALGRILTYNPRTRAEGRKLLSKYPNDPEAADALRQALVWDSQNPSTAGDIRSYLEKHPDQQLSTALQSDERLHAEQVRRAGPALTPEQKAANEARAAQGREVASAYTALNAKRYSEAEQRFNAMLERDPSDSKALAGLGYIRMQQSNFGGAISYLSQAQANGDRSEGLAKALNDARYYYTLREATGSLNEGDLNAAIANFEKAYEMRPTDAAALQGLGGTQLSAEQFDAAIATYKSYTKLHPRDVAAWKGLFLAYAAANQFTLALDTDRAIPASLKSQLVRDPDYLRTLASVYSAQNRDAEAQRILQMALQLPFPANARGLRADVQMQYAALLEAAGHHAQAAGLYREVLGADSTNTNAWVGLIQTEHSLGNDADAFAQLSQMPPANFQAAMREPGFATTVASIYISQGRDDLAQNTLVEFLNSQVANHQKPFVAAQVTLANLYLKHNDTAHAFPLFEDILTNNPDRPDAWKGLLNSLHATGHDAEALAEIQQMSPEMRRQLEADPDYLQLVGSIYASLGHPQDAMRFLGRAQAHYQQEGMTEPSTLGVQSAWLLFNAREDGRLYRQLMQIGGRNDLTDEQRREVQTIWTSWAVRRSQQSLAAGNPRRAIAILNAAARAFPNNPAVLKALGSGYAAAGLNKEAIQIFRAQDLSTGTAADYYAAINAALSANDLKDAETWLRFGLVQYPRDAQMLGLAARFETARGNTGRAADYYQASLKAMPQPDPGAELAEALAKAASPTRPPLPERSEDLATLLAQPDGLPPRPGAGDVDTRPYLPGFANAGAQAPVVMRGRSRATTAATAPAQSYGTPTSLYGTSAAPGYTYANPAPAAPPSYDSSPLAYPTYPDVASPSTSGGSNTYLPGNGQGSGAKGGTLGDYVPPQSAVSTRPLPGRTTDQARLAVLRLHVSAAAERRYQPFLPGESTPVDPADVIAGDPDSLAKLVREAPEEVVSVKEARWTKATVALRGTLASGSSANTLRTVAFAPQQSSEASNPFASYGKSTAKKSSAKRSTSSKRTAAASHSAKTAKTEQENSFSHFGEAQGASTHSAAQEPKYVPPPVYVPGETTAHSARPASRTIHFPPESTPAAREEARRRAEAIHANQSNAPLVLEGVSHPPVENYDTETNGVTPRMSPTQFSTSPYSPAQMQGAQMSQPQPPTAPQATLGDLQQQSGASSQQYTPGQQYPQPRTGPSYTGSGFSSAGSTSTPRQRTSTRRATTTTPTVPEQTTQAPMSYPIYPQPLQNEGTPSMPGPYPLPTPPSDAIIQEQGAPPLRGYFDPRTSMNPKEPLTEREQTQLNLAQIEGSFSSWLGGSAAGRYRSGRPGVDRLISLEAPFEASWAMGRSARLTAVPRAVFLNAGQLVLDPTAPVGPLIGTLYSNATSAPTQQYASGVGGELQFTTATFGAALGYSPYGFPVSNLIGRARWRPGNWHFTFYGGRDSVKETMLSYAGMRDPGSPFGNIWGGVVENGGGARFDAGDEHAGLYVQLEGADVTGYHVLENHKFDGTMGAYFRVKTWPEYGSLNIGGTLFGEHYQYNERGETYGLGGYFSPNVYFLAAVPISFTGHWMENLHYVINGSVGVQTFQEDSQVYYPLDGPSQAGVPASACTPVCGLQVNANTGLNYSVDAQLAYHVNDHWYIGAFLSGNNTNNYNTITGGFFARYTFRPQAQTVEYPTGLFPIEGIRPLRVP